MRQNGYPERDVSDSFAFLYIEDDKQVGHDIPLAGVCGCFRGGGGGGVVNCFKKSLLKLLAHTISTFFYFFFKGVHMMGTFK